MARLTLTPSQVTRAGLTLPAETTLVAVDGGQFANNGVDTFLLAHNTNGASTARTLTIHISKLIDGAAVADKTFSIAAGTTKLIGPFPTDFYGSTMTVDVDNAELKLSVFSLT